MEKRKPWLIADGYTCYIPAGRLELGEVEYPAGETPPLSRAIVENIVADRGFGFIVYEKGEKKVFFHRSALEGIKFEELSEGDALAFEVEETEKGPRATLIRSFREGALND